MKAYGKLWVVLLVVWTLISIVTPKPSPIQTAILDTVMVETANSYGSGILVTRVENGHRITYVWTVAHVPTEPDNEVICGICGRPIIKDVKIKEWSGREATAEIVAYTQPGDSRDLALLRVTTPDWSDRSVRFLHGAPPEVGTPVFHVGNFLGPKLHHSYVTGVVSFIGREDDGTYDQISASTYPGGSGGGYYLTTGECIGLADASIGMTQTLIVPVRLIEQWAKEKHLEFALP